jgi:hypothetical protein
MHGPAGLFALVAKHAGSNNMKRLLIGEYVRSDDHERGN